MRYFGFVLVGWVLAGALMFALFVGSLGFSKNANTRNVQAWYEVKDAAMQAETSGPRLILVGGSSGLFGISMEQVARELGVPAVNYAVHAGVLLDYILQRVQSHLRPGDIVLFVPEYEYYHDRKETDLHVNYVLGNDPSYLRRIPVTTSLRYFLGVRADTLMNSVRRLIPSEREAFDRALAYSRGRLNAHGDFLLNDTAKRTEAEERALESATALPSLSIPLIINEDAWGEIDAFVSDCTRRGVTVLAMFPPTIDFPDYHTPEAQKRMDDLVVKWQSLGVTVLGTPQESLYPISKFYDTVYHLNSDGTAENTEKLIEQLRPYLQKFTPPTNSGPSNED